jgi:hypothetical protein
MERLTTQDTPSLNDKPLDDQGDKMLHPAAVCKICNGTGQVERRWHTQNCKCVKCEVCKGSATGHERLMPCCVKCVREYIRRTKERTQK